jgi:methyl-accepting chemotaxis protein
VQGAGESDFVARIEHLLEQIIQGEFNEVLDGTDQAACVLLPLVQHIREKNFGMLRAMADIWVEQTQPLFAVARTKADMQELGHRTQAIASATDELLASIEEIGRTTDGVAREAQDVHDKVGIGTQAADAAVGSIRESAAAVNDLSAKIDTLGTSIEQIVGIVKTIEDIASQTNLLALNATIEAARAGEAGKGFAVVAGEVKTLSNQTARATEDIRQRIGGLQSSMSEIVAAMQSSGRTVESGSQAVLQAGEAIQGINSSVEAVTRNMTTVASIIQEQMAATTEVDSSINATAGMSSHALETIDGLAGAVDKVSAVVQPRLQELSKRLSDRALVQLARSDHASFKKRVIDTLVGRGNTKDSDLPDHHNCRFGKWYDSLQDPTLRSSGAYRNIEDPHLRVHAHGKEALAHFHAGEFQAAVNAAGKMEEASHEVFAALDDMAKVLAARGAA